MKKIILALPFFAIFFSCSEMGTSENEKTTTKEEKNISKIDVSITPSNSYSDLF